jgi:hypothetical protein
MICRKHYTCHSDALLTQPLLLIAEAAIAVQVMVM